MSRYLMTQESKPGLIDLAAAGRLLLLVTAFSVASCSDEKPPESTATDDTATTQQTPVIDQPPPPATPEEALLDALSAVDRPVEDRARDEFRKPDAVLNYFGVQPGQSVVELIAGGGYYTEILSRYLGPQGRLYVTRLSDKERAARLSTVVVLQDLAQVPADSVDFAFTSLNYHDMVNLGTDRVTLLAQIMRVLKPGATFGVIDHAAEEKSADRDVGTLHRIDEQFVKDEVTAAGFQWVDSSDVLRHPEDDRRTRVMETAIRGRTDQFVLKFVKPLPQAVTNENTEGALSVADDEINNGADAGATEVPVIVPALQSISEVPSEQPSAPEVVEPASAEVAPAAVESAESAIAPSD